MRKSEDTAVEQYLKSKRIASELISRLHDTNAPTPTLQQFAAENTEFEAFREHVSSAENLSSELSQMQQANAAESAGRLSVKISRRINRRLTAWRAAVAIVIMVTAGTTLLLLRMPNSDREQIAETTELPMLILSNGENVKLAENGQIQENKTTVATVNKGLTYSNQHRAESIYNTLVVPRKHTYTVTLSDGTEVILNANSSLRYPVAFGSGQRRVLLTGEAYFKVTKSDQPFIVSCSHADIRVYGTMFNVNTNLSDRIETVLISGSVGIIPHFDPSQERKLLPDQRGVYFVSEHAVQIETVNTDNYTGWVENQFNYLAQPLSRVIGDISNYYGVKIYLSPEMGQSLVTLIASRNESLAEMMKFIETTLGVKFELTGKEEYILK